MLSSRYSAWNGWAIANKFIHYRTTYALGSIDRAGKLIQYSSISGGSQGVYTKS